MGKDRGFRITSKQCRAARCLLKWNINDLAKTTGLPSKRLDGFERSAVILQSAENDSILKAFKKEGLIFTTDLEVFLSNGAKDDSTGTKAQGGGTQTTGGQGDGMTILIMPDGTQVVTDQTAGAGRDENQEKDRL